MMVDLDDDPDWSQNDSIEDEDDDRFHSVFVRQSIEFFIFFELTRFSNAVIGESSLDRLACALGGKTVLNYILTTVQTMLQNGETSFEKNRSHNLSN